MVAEHDMARIVVQLLVDAEIRDNETAQTAVARAVETYATQLRAGTVELEVADEDTEVEAQRITDVSMH